MKQIERKTDLGNGKSVSTAWRVPEDYDGNTAVVLAHGAGNDMHAEFIRAMHERYADAGLMAVKFNFLYKERGGKMPDRQHVLLDTWQAVVAAVRGDPDLAPRNLFYAGKSLGGRIASMLAAEEGGPAGLIFLGYPLHPAGKPDRLRIDHLDRVRCPMLFIQGTRDSLCDLQILQKVLDDIGDPKNELHRVEGGDHSFKLPKKLKREPSDVYEEIAARSVAFMEAYAR